MDFFDSISLPFRVWQFTGLSPYNLKSSEKQSEPSKIYRNSIIVVIAIQLLIAILCVILFSEIVPPKNKQTIRVLDGLIMWLAQFTAMVIFWESYGKCRIQQNFFHKINSIDFLMEFKIGIRPDYPKKKKLNTRHLFGLLVLIVANFVTIFVVMYIDMILRIDGGQSSTHHI